MKLLKAMSAFSREQCVPFAYRYRYTSGSDVLTCCMRQISHSWGHLPWGRIPTGTYCNPWGHFQWVEYFFTLFGKQNATNVGKDFVSCGLMEKAIWHTILFHANYFYGQNAPWQETRCTLAISSCHLLIRVSTLSSMFSLNGSGLVTGRTFFSGSFGFSRPAWRYLSNFTVR
jgi:hypothetical protein